MDHASRAPHSSLGPHVGLSWMPRVLAGDALAPLCPAAPCPERGGSFRRDVVGWHHGGSARSVFGLGRAACGFDPRDRPSAAAARPTLSPGHLARSGGDCAHAADQCRVGAAVKSLGTSGLGSGARVASGSAVDAQRDVCKRYHCPRNVDTYQPALTCSTDGSALDGASALARVRMGCRRDREPDGGTDLHRGRRARPGEPTAPTASRCAVGSRQPRRSLESRRTRGTGDAGRNCLGRAPRRGG